MLWNLLRVNELVACKLLDLLVASFRSFVAQAVGYIQVSKAGNAHLCGDPVIAGIGQVPENV
jgi:hypothetical protein